MFKNIFFFLTISFCAFLITSVAYACDPLGCLLGGHKQDTLILGEVVSTTNDSLDIKIIFIFPQNQVRSLKEGFKITVNNFSETVNLTKEEANGVTVGKKYLMSLNQNDNFYVPAWGIYEVTGTTYSDAQLAKNKTGDEAALQIFINSGGTEKDFYFIEDKAFWRPNDGQWGIQIFPATSKLEIQKVESTPIQKDENILWYCAGIVVLVLIGSLVLISRTKKNII
jgi:hypothetical protein